MAAGGAGWLGADWSGAGCAGWAGAAAWPAGGSGAPTATLSTVAAGAGVWLTWDSDTGKSA